MKPRPRPSSEIDDDVMVEFARMLLAALELPEVQEAIADLIPQPQPAPMLRPAPAAPVRGTRGARRG